MGQKPKHMLVSEWIRERIYDGTFPYDSKLLSENELAEQFHMSRQTVRQAIGTLVNEGLLLRRRGSGTYIAYEQRVQRIATKNIAVITTYFDEYIFPGVIKGIDKVLTEHGYHMNLGITYNKTGNENTLITSMLANGVDGFLIEPTKSAFPTPNRVLYQEMVQKKIPVVFLNGYYASQEFPYVSMDDYASGKLATNHLIERGHRRLFGVFKSDDIQGHFRYSGFINAVKDYGLAYDDDRVLWYVTEDLGQVFNPENDAYLLARIGDSTGIVCYNDEISIRLLEVFRRNGKQVPRDYSMVSFDNSNLSNLGDVGLSSVNYPSEEIGGAAAHKLIRILSGGKQEGNLSLAPELIRRGSVRDLCMSSKTDEGKKGK